MLPAPVLFGINLPGVDAEKYGSWEHILGPVNGNLSHTMLARVFTISLKSIRLILLSGLLTVYVSE